VLSLANSCLASIKSRITRFYQERRIRDIYNVEGIIVMTLLADVLGTSRIFEDLLDLVNDWQPTARFHFCRSLRKVGVYNHGMNLLYESMTTCAGKKIRRISLEVRRSPASRNQVSRRLVRLPSQ